MFLKIQNGSGNSEQTLDNDVLDMETTWRSIAMNLRLKETLQNTGINICFIHIFYVHFRRCLHALSNTLSVDSVIVIIFRLVTLTFAGKLQCYTIPHRLNSASNHDRNPEIYIVLTLSEIKIILHVCVFFLTTSRHPNIFFHLIV